MHNNRWLAIGCVGVVVATTLFGGNTASAASSSSSRPHQVTINIPALPGQIPSQWLNYQGPPRANVVLPAGYNPHLRYPLLVLLHGLGGNFDWFDQQGLISGFDGLDAIIVMPEGGPGGWYADWWNGGERGGPAWESYELEVVLPTILARYPILPQRRYHAIAGFSMGGLGAVFLGGRLPGFFGSVASLSGFVDPQFLAPAIQPAMALESHASTKGDSELDPVYGPPYGFYSDGHNPTLLTMNLKQTRVYETTGTGIPNSGNLALLAYGAGGADELATGAWEESLVIYPMSELYHQALAAAGVDVTYQVHSGGHDLPAFTKEIKDLLAWGLFKPVTTDPSSWANDTVASTGQLWDISYRFAKAPNAVVQFRQSGTTLSISAAGADVAITTGGGCVIQAPTPTTIQLPNRSCSAGRPAASAP